MNETDHQDISEILLKVALNTITLAPNKDISIIIEFSAFFIADIYIIMY